MRLLLALVTLALLAPAVAARELTVEAYEDVQTNEYWFEVEGMEGRNPEITLEKGENVTVHFINEGSQIHNLNFGAVIGASTELLQPGENETITFTVPEEAVDGEYWCDPHRALGMVGPLNIAEAGEVEPEEEPVGTPGDEGEEATGGEDTPAVGPVLAALAAVGAALALRRR